MDFEVVPCAREEIIEILGNDTSGDYKDSEIVEHEFAQCLDCGRWHLNASDLVCFECNGSESGFKVVKQIVVSKKFR